MMLFTMGLGSRLAIAGWILYACAHAAIKSGLSFTLAFFCIACGL